MRPPHRPASRVPGSPSRWQLPRQREFRHGLIARPHGAWVPALPVAAPFPRAQHADRGHARPVGAHEHEKITPATADRNRAHAGSFYVSAGRTRTCWRTGRRFLTTAPDFTASALRSHALQLGLHVRQRAVVTLGRNVNPAPSNPANISRSVRATIGGRPQAVRSSTVFFDAPSDRCVLAPSIPPCARGRSAPAPHQNPAGRRPVLRGVAHSLQIGARAV